MGTMHSRRWRVLWAIAAGSLLYLLQILPILSAALASPEGYVPAWAIRNLDLPQYLTWAEAGRNAWVFPNYHAPWRNEPWMFQPLMSVVGHVAQWTRQPLVLIYNLCHWLVVVAGTYCLIAALRTFCPRRSEAQWAVFWMIFSVPLFLLAYPLAGLTPLPRQFFAVGMITWGYETADGLIRGGQSNCFSLSWSTTVILAGVTLLGRFLQSRDRQLYWAFCALVGVATFLHPFESFLLVPLAYAALVLAKQFGPAMLVTPLVATGLGMSPYLWATLQSESLRDASGLLDWRMSSPLWVPSSFGIPAILLIYLLLLRLRLPEATDKLLACWFGLCPVLAYVPGIPFPLHLFNGYVICIGMLLVRRYRADPKLVATISRAPRLRQTLTAAVALLSLVSLALFYRQAWQDGRRAETELLLSAVEPAEQSSLLAILRSLPRDGAVLAPAELAPWVATTLHPAWGSHDFLSITYTAQAKEASRFYAGETTEEQRLAFISAQRFRYVVTSRPGLLPSRDPIASAGRYQIYAFPGNTLGPYPGAAALGLTTSSTLRQGVLQKLQSWMQIRPRGL